MGSLSQKAYSGFSADDPEFLQKAATNLNNMLIGKLNNTGTLALTINAKTTTVSDARCGPGTIISLMPTSSDGSAALTTWYASSRTNGSFTLTHQSTSTSNATAAYSLLG